MATTSQVASIRKGVVELAILGLLANGPRYGQQLVEELSQQAALALTPGTVYPLVSRLLKDRMIASTWEESPVGPPRKYYRLTAAGTRRLSDLTEAWRQVRSALDVILKEKP